jgi:hypothetical protein
MIRTLELLSNGRAVNNRGKLLFGFWPELTFEPVLDMSI